MNERKNILFGNIIVLDGKKQVKIKDAVFTEGINLYKQQKILKILSFKIVGQTSNLKTM